jgi:hypothetical protein
MFDLLVKIACFVKQRFFKVLKAVDKVPVPRKHYRFVIYRLRIKLVSLFRPEDTSLVQNLSISCKLRVRNIL